MTNASRPAPKRLMTVGGLCHSSIYRVDAIPPAPGKALASEMIQVADGMALSAGFAFMRLGGAAEVCARIGDDELGRSIKKDLAAEGLDTSGLRCLPGVKTSQAAIIVDRQGDRLVVPFHDEQVDKSPEWLPLAALARVDMLHCDARWVEGAERAMRAARALGVPTMIDGDVAPIETLRRLVPLADYAVFSDAGLQLYAGDDDVEAALRLVGTAHGGHVGASCGAHGYLWLEDGCIRHVPAPRVDPVDTLSAGDVFHGALALGVLEGRPIADAARFACVAASLKCLRFGGRLGCPSRAEVDAGVRRFYDDRQERR